MPTCRVYLLTYRRNNLLRRALQSLLNQTFTDWICELHNDEPEDSFPQRLVNQIADPRIQIINHTENLGATRTFNLVFKAVPESFISLLEDDNWWEPHFLETMLQSMKLHPAVQVAWSNMRFWQEEKDGSWTDTGRNIWDCLPTDDLKLFYWGQSQQVMGALHSNGALMVRAQSAEHFIIPEETSFAAVELVRERSFPFPILFVPQICANFAITQTTARSFDRAIWGQMQILLFASFFKHHQLESEALKQFCAELRSRTARSSNALFFAALICPECRFILRYAVLSDWLFFVASCCKRPQTTFKILRTRQLYPEIWNFLERETANRVRELQTTHAALPGKL
jgi:glycosyltransferase involved in cell wall biosynthesis